MSSSAGHEMPHEALLALLRCPDSAAGLRRDGDSLVCDPPGERRYALEAGIPVLLPEARGGDPRTRAAAAASERAIAESFRARGDSYFADNYGEPGNPSRIARLDLVVRLLAGLVRPGATVLDAGAGPAVLGEEVRSLGARYVALDRSVDNLVAAHRRLGSLDAVVGTLESLPFKDGAFDVAVASGCLEYVPEMRTAITELCRVTTPGGFVVASFPNARSPGRRWDEAVVHPLSRVRTRLVGGGDAIYRRRLARVEDVQEAFARAGAVVDSVEYCNAGLLGHPLSSAERLRAAELRAARRSPRVRRRASEFVVAAVVP